MTERLERLSAALSDRYHLLRELGVGGMATVYLAEDLKHNRQVAVKVLRTELSAQLGVSRFLKEIEVTANLQHPHILPLFDSGEADGVLFYVMPFVNGETLREKIDREGELPIAEVVRLLREVADALSYAHGRGVVHRDIKPANVLLAGRHAMVADFGIAKAVTAAAGGDIRTTLGAAVGTPSYMAPEQALAQPHVDHRADIYALGAMAYEMLTGHPPFTGRTAVAVLYCHVSVAPTPVRTLRVTIPSELGDLVMKCLEKNPTDRWQTADEVLRQLDVLAISGERIRQDGSNVRLASTVSSRGFRYTRSAVAGALLMSAAAAWLAVNRFARADVAPVQSEKVRRGESDSAVVNGSPVNQVSANNAMVVRAENETGTGKLAPVAQKPIASDRPSRRQPLSSTPSEETDKSQPKSLAPDPVDVALLSSLLSEFSQAIEAGDTANMRAVYPSMSDGQKANWTAFFEAMKTFRAGLTLHGLVVYGDSARASVAGAYYYVQPNGVANRTTIKYGVTFARWLDGWKILSMK